jgi:CBS domain-containing protein
MKPSATFRTPLNAGDICTRVVTIAFPSMALNEAARLMRDRHVGCLVVVEERTLDDRVVVGMLTDRDIAIGVVAADRDPHGMRVGDLMSKGVISAREEDSLADLLLAMRRKGVRRVPVVSPQGSLIGIVALDDVLAQVAEELAEVGPLLGREAPHRWLGRQT